MHLTKEAVRAAPIPYEDVPVPELQEGGEIRVRCLSALQKDQWDAGFWTTDEATGKPRYSAIGARARLLALACCHEDFSPLFDAEDVAWLQEFRADVADRLYEAAERVSGLRADLEALKKAFGAAQAGASRTSSR